MKKNMRTTWIAEMANNFKSAEKSNPSTVGGFVIGNTVVCMVLSTEKPKIGVARCSPEDEFDLDTGIAIAWARAFHISIPDCVTAKTKSVRIFDMKINQKFRVCGHTYVKVCDARSGTYVVDIDTMKATLLGRQTYGTPIDE